MAWHCLSSYWSRLLSYSIKTSGCNKSDRSSYSFTIIKTIILQPIILIRLHIFKRYLPIGIQEVPSETWYACNYGSVNLNDQWMMFLSRTSLMDISHDDMALQGCPASSQVTDNFVDTWPAYLITSSVKQWSWWSGEIEHCNLIFSISVALWKACWVVIWSRLIGLNYWTACHYILYTHSCSPGDDL